MIASYIHVDSTSNRSSMSSSRPSARPAMCALAECSMDGNILEQYICNRANEQKWRKTTHGKLYMHAVAHQSWTHGTSLSTGLTYPLNLFLSMPIDVASMTNVSCECGRSLQCGHVNISSCFKSNDCRKACMANLHFFRAQGVVVVQSCFLTMTTCPRCWPPQTTAGTRNIIWI